MEVNDGSRIENCKHGLRCFEKDCGFNHKLNHEGRKLLTMKDKIRKEIEEIGKNGMPKWD